MGTVKADVGVKCPSCNSEAVYRNGHIKTGKQRFICLICGIQFCPDAKRTLVKGKPLCPHCGKPMNVYKLEGNVIRFRCSDYPACNTYRKFTMIEISKPALALHPRT